MTTQMQVTLPWPMRTLSPNARAHWRVTAKSKALYRRTCASLAKEAGLERMGPDSRLHLHLTFIPPDRRQRDLDNCIASMKSGLDGVADALGVDDSRWTLAFSMLDTGEIGGMVRVRIERLE